MGLRWIPAFEDHIYAMYNTIAAQMSVFWFELILNPWVIGQKLWSNFLSVSSQLF